jgi:hypothetical protein
MVYKLGAGVAFFSWLSSFSVRLLIVECLVANANLFPDNVVVDLTGAGRQHFRHKKSCPLPDSFFAMM